MMQKIRNGQGTIFGLSSTIKCDKNYTSTDILVKSQISFILCYYSQFYDGSLYLVMHPLMYLIHMHQTGNSSTNDLEMYIIKKKAKDAPLMPISSSLLWIPHHPPLPPYG
jgi:hypothetical protein